VLLVFVGDGASKRTLRARVDGLQLSNVKLMPYASREAPTASSSPSKRSPRSHLTSMSRSTESRIRA